MNVELLVVGNMAGLMAEANFEGFGFEYRAGEAMNIFRGN
jgi:hypothetical protein